MQYRLLRNNKETGPYTKEQLEQIGLKPYDLLWMEGRGGAWMYASEIDDLKSIAPMVEEQPYERFYKGKKEQTTTSSSKQNSSVATNTATPKPPKPRIRITGDKVVMIDNTTLQQPQPINNIVSSLPDVKQPVAAAKPAVKQEAAAHVQTVGLDWEEMYSDWKGETAPQESAAPAPVAQTMDEVKQRYEESKLKYLDEKQNKTANGAKQNIMAAIAVLVLAIGGYAGYKMSNSGSSVRTTQVAPTIEKAEVIQDDNNPQLNATNSIAANTNTTSSQTLSPADAGKTKPVEIKNTVLADSSKKVMGSSLPSLEKKEKNSIVLTGNKEQPPVTTPKTKAADIAVVKPAEKNNLPPVTPVANKTNTAKDNDKKDNTALNSMNKNVVTPVVQNPSADQPVAIKKEAPKKKISDYVTVNRLGSSSNSASVQNVLLSVKNITDFPIDLAVIDIQYYGANGRFQKGETMYVKDIASGNNINVRIPDSKTSRTISYKVSLVSAEQKTLYLVGE